MAAAVSEAEREYALGGFVAGVRADGRDRLDFRPIQVEKNVVQQANGSARVVLGGTEVVVGVKAELGSPDRADPGAGRIEVSASVSPLAGPQWAGRPGDELAGAVASLLRDAYRAEPPLSGGGDADEDQVGGLSLGAIGATRASSMRWTLESLCVARGTTCWVLFVDVVVVAIDGAVADAASLAARAALLTTLLPAVEVGEAAEGEEPELELGDLTEKVAAEPVPVLVTALVPSPGAAPVLDPTAIEEASAEAVLVVGADALGAVTAVAKRGRGGADAASLMDALGAVEAAAPRLIAALGACLAKN